MGNKIYFQNPYAVKMNLQTHNLKLNNESRGVKEAHDFTLDDLSLLFLKPRRPRPSKYKNLAYHPLKN